MLPGPTGSNDYIDSIGRGFPTPNESSLRTGLTPGGGGSMFPAPSPSSQAIIQQLQNGGATPLTIEFHRTAMNAAKKNGMNAPTSNPPNESDAGNAASAVAKGSQPPVNDPFTHHDAADAANGLFMLAKGGQANSAQFAVPSQSSIPMQTIQQTEEPGETGRVTRSQNANGAAAVNGRAGSGDASDTQVEQEKPAPKGRTKKNTVNKAGGAQSNRRKAEGSPAKGSNKRARANNGSVSTDVNSEAGESDDEDDMKRKQGDSKRMTDDEKRKNFLERNR